MEITGKIIEVLAPRTGTSMKTGAHWMSQEYVIETDEQYPRRLCFSVLGEDKIREMNLQMGRSYTVSLDFSARKTNDKWYNQIKGWKAVEKA